MTNNDYDKIKKDFNIKFKEYKKDFMKLTDLALEMRYLSKKYLDNNKRLSNVYNNLFEKINEYIVLNYSRENLNYYFKKVS